MSNYSFDTFLDKCVDLKNNNISFVVCSLVDIKGSTPNQIGAKCIVTDGGLFWGTVGGGKLENKVINTAKELLSDGSSNHSFLKEWNLQKDIGMSCGGVASVYFESHKSTSDWTIAVFGAGHVAQELIPLLLKLNCNVICTDHRNEWLNKLPENNRLKKVLSVAEKTYVDTFSELPKNAYICSLTMGHATDLPVVCEALKRNFPYVGAIGSKQKALVLRKDLKINGLDDVSIGSLFCPIGEDLGSNEPFEIAISIISQLLRQKTK